MICLKICKTCLASELINTYHTVFIFHFSFLGFLNQIVCQNILGTLDTFLFMELKEGIKYSDLVLDVPLGLLALDAELASEVDLVAGAHLDRPKNVGHVIGEY